VYWCSYQVPIFLVRFENKLEYYWQIFETFSKTIFHENLSIDSRVFRCGRRYRRKDIPKLIDGFPNFVNSPNSQKSTWVNILNFFSRNVLRFPTASLIKGLGNNYIFSNRGQYYTFIEVVQIIQSIRWPTFYILGFITHANFSNKTHSSLLSLSQTFLRVIHKYFIQTHSKILRYYSV
jgi:hypothetical protein